MVLVDTGVGFGAAFGENLFEEGVKEFFLILGDGINAGLILIWI